MGIDKNNNKCIVESMIDSPIDSGPRERERERERNSDNCISTISKTIYILK